MMTINIFFFEFPEMFSKMEFGLDTQKQVDVGRPPMNITLEEGTYNTLCKTERSNPAADIKIFLDDVEQPGAITTLEDKDRIEPPHTWNVQNSITLTLDSTHTNKILKCVALVNKETLMKKEMSYKLTTFKNSMMSGTAYPSRAPEFTPGFLWGSCCSIFIFLCCVL
jgi:hypothetical protein